MAVNLKAPEGREIIYRLIPAADVIVSNFQAGVMDSLGLGFEPLSQINPRLIHATGSAYGQIIGAKVSKTLDRSAVLG